MQNNTFPRPPNETDPVKIWAQTEASLTAKTCIEVVGVYTDNTELHIRNIGCGLEAMIGGQPFGLYNTI